MSDRDLSPFFAPKSIAVVGAGERATSSGGAIMQMLRQAGYGGRVVPVNPKGGTIFGYESVTSIGASDPPVDLAVIVIRPDAILDAAKEAAAASKTCSSCPAASPRRGRSARSATRNSPSLPRRAASRSPGRIVPASSVSIRPGASPPPSCATCRPAPRRASNGLAFIFQSGALAEEIIDKANARACRSPRSCRSATPSISVSRTTLPGWASGRRSARRCSTSNRSRTTNASAA
jgi:hypothetical protein